MKKLFIISPISIAGCLITKGFADGFRKNGYFVVEKDIREVTFEEIKKFNPDIILGYCYGYLNSEELTKDLRGNKDYKFIHYFGDEPNSRFAYTDRPEIYKLLKTTKNAEIFIWDSEFINEFDKAYYMPLAVNPALYKKEFEGFEHNISFVGRPLTEKRQSILTKLIKQFGKISIFCYKDHFERSINQIKEKNILTERELDLYKASYKGFVKTEEELAQIYNSTKVNLNITEQGINNINYRVFEVLASSGFLLTDYMKDLPKLFEIGKELESYKNEEEMFDKINFYLKNQNLAQAIALNGRRCIVNNHSFKNRVNKIIKMIGT